MFGSFTTEKRRHIVSGFSFVIAVAAMLTLQGAGSLLYGADIFQFQGPYTRVTSGCSLLESRSGEAAMHNPANLTYTGSSWYADVGLTNFNYQVTPASTGETGALSMPVIPLASFGGSWRAGSKLAFGAAFVPLGAPGVKTHLKRFPSEFQGETTTRDVEAGQTAFKVASGVGLKLSRAMRLGLGATLHYDENSITVLDDEHAPFLQFGIKSMYLHPQLAASGVIAPALSWAVGYRPSATANYKLSSKVVSEGSTNSASGSEYHAATYEVAASLSFSPLFTPYFQYTREQWLDGTFKSTPPTEMIAGNDAPTAFVNANHFVVGVRTAPAPGYRFYGGVGLYQPNKEEGVKDASNKALFVGVGPRDFEGLRRKQYTLGYRHAQKGGRDVIGYFSYIYASRVTSEAAPSAAFYQLRLFMLGGSIIIK
jgi:hypothetical protein